MGASYFGSVDMKLLIEGYPYPVEKLNELLPNVDELDVTNGVAYVNYIGYYYYTKKAQPIFILPKVVVDQYDNVFGVEGLRPEDIVDLDDVRNPLTQNQRQFIYGLSVWIYRAIAVYRSDCLQKGKDNTIIRQQNAIKIGSGKRYANNTFLDIILSLIDFYERNKDWFMFIVKNSHRGFNKINWNRTIAKSQVVIQGNEVVYFDPVTKKRCINFEEDLLIIFYSILNYIKETYGFPIRLNVNYELITGKQFARYMPHKRQDGTIDQGFGVLRLRQIKYKYFSDKSLALWNLCFAFFDQSRNVRINAHFNEFLLAKNFNIVFEAIIDELIGDYEFQDRLNKKQEDGKEVDHMFLYKSLTSIDPDKNVYYIGDSKYYKQKSQISKESIAKQYTYARNVIQWNLNLFLGVATDEKTKSTDFCLRDEITEGYNIIPNFFISATVPNDLSYSDTISETNKNAKTFVSQQFCNRLFDRDTLLITHYDVNFLYVVSLYARNNAYQKKEWRDRVREIFRRKIQDELQSRYGFYAMRAKPGVDTHEYIDTHFHDILGKVYAPYEDKSIITLALEDKYTTENERLLAQLNEDFDVVQCKLGQDPRKLLPSIKDVEVLRSNKKRGVLLLTLIEKDDVKRDLIETNKIVAVGLKDSEGSAKIIENIYNIGTLLVHKKRKEDQMTFPVKTLRVLPFSKLPEKVVIYPKGKGLYIVLELGDMDKDLTAALDVSRCRPDYDANYSTLDELYCVE